MAYVRLYQSGFEFRVGAEFNQASGNGSNNIFNDQVHTGDYSMNTGTSLASFGFGRMVNQIRCNYFAYKPGSGTGTMIGVYGIKNTAHTLIRFLYNSGTDTFDLEYGGSTVVNVPAPMFGWNTGSWHTIGCTCKAGDGGWFSFYLDGELVYRHEGDLFDDDGLGAVTQGNNSHVDDVFVDECTADEDDNCPPSPRFYPLQAIGNGDNDAWIPEGGDNSIYAIRNVNNQIYNQFNAVPPFVYAGAADLKTDWSFPQPPTDEKLRAVIAYALMQKGKAEVATQARFYMLDGVTVANSPDMDLPTAAQIVWHRFSEAAGGGAIGYEHLVRSYFGVESRGSF